MYLSISKHGSSTRLFFKAENFLERKVSLIVQFSLSTMLLQFLYRFSFHKSWWYFLHLSTVLYSVINLANGWGNIRHESSSPNDSSVQSWFVSSASSQSVIRIELNRYYQIPYYPKCCYDLCQILDWNWCVFNSSNLD